MILKLIFGNSGLLKYWEVTKWLKKIPEASFQSYFFSDTWLVQCARKNR